jgi:hypothetical protein
MVGSAALAATLRHRRHLDAELGDLELADRDPIALSRVVAMVGYSPRDASISPAPSSARRGP